MTPAEAMLSEKFTRLQPTLTEAGRRRWVATDALARGRGRESLPAKSPELLPALHELVSPGTRGAPPKPAARDQQKHRQTGAA